MTKPLLPGQHVGLEAILNYTEDHRAGLLKWMEQDRGEMVAEPIDGRFLLQLQVQESEELLYVSSVNGNALAQVVLDAVKNGKDIGLTSWEHHLRLIGDSSTPFRKWQYRRREAKRMKEILEASQSSKTLRKAS